MEANTTEGNAMQTQTLKPCPVSTSLFTRGTNGVYVAEMSDLPYGLGRVYDDACDEGLTLVSARTGREVVMVVSDVRTRDGELEYLELTPAHRYAPSIVIHLYND